ncbi:MAG: hypothetical protein NTU44_13990 [Bacteroidetes bacterium]|nr:hypothetical protein [Bacteroidota bacterium]
MMNKTWQNRLLHKVLVLILTQCCLLLIQVKAAETGSPEGSSSQNNTVEDTISRLVFLAHKAHVKDNNPDKADSLLQQAIAMAEMTYVPETILQVYNDYFECMNQGTYDKSRWNLAEKASLLCNHLSDKRLCWKTYYNIVDVCLSNYHYDMAQEYCLRASSLAEEMKNDTLKAKSFLVTGNMLEMKNHLIEAFKNYLQALNIAENQRNRRLLAECYKSLSEFYKRRKNFDKAIEYKLKQGDLIKSFSPVDSLALMWIQFELESININSRRDVNERNIEFLLKYARSHNEKLLRSSVMYGYRSYLIDNEKFDELFDYYTNKDPAELNSLYSTNPTSYYRIKALLFEHTRKIDSAIVCFNKARELLEYHPNKILKANFFIRFGQFYARNRLPGKSVEMFTQAYQLASDANYLEYAITATKGLEDAYAELKDFENAWIYSRKTMALSDSMANIAEKDDLLLLEINNTARIREEAIARDKLETEQRHRIQYTAIIILMVVVFVVLIILGSFKVPNWVIQFLGFVSFIFLFEFIVLLADQIIHEMTGGEPWKVLAIKVVLIGILLPIHHYFEKKVIIYLMNNKLIDFSAFSLKRYMKEIFFPHNHESRQKA